MADNKSSLIQIAQDVLDVADQAIKIKGVIAFPPGLATEAKQDSQTVELQAIKGHVDGIETQLGTLLLQTDGIESSLTSIDAKVATSTKQDNQITELQAIKGHVDGVESKFDTLITQTDGIEGSLSSIDAKVATSDKQDSQITELVAIKGHVDNVESSLTSIDTKIATSAKQDSQITELQAIKGHVDGVETKLDTLILQTDAIEGNLSTLITQTDAVEGSLSSIDTKVATSANQTAQTTELQAIKNNTARLDYVGRVRLVYSSTNVTTGAWVQLLASVGATAVKEIEIFDSSGETLELGVGVAASEVSKSYVFPGGNGKIPMQIAANDRLAIKAVSATANSGEIVINLYG